MGRTFQYLCPHCQYQARISGGADSGMNCNVQTILCRECHALYDVFTRLRKRKDEAAVAAAQRTQRLMQTEIIIPPILLIEKTVYEFSEEPRPRKPVRATYWETFKPACPNSPTHRIDLWNDPGRCPRCGNFMERNGFPYRLWD